MKHSSIFKGWLKINSTLKSKFSHVMVELNSPNFALRLMLTCSVSIQIVTSDTIFKKTNVKSIEIKCIVIET